MKGSFNLCTRNKPIWSRYTKIRKTHVFFTFDVELSQRYKKKADIRRLLTKRTKLWEDNKYEELVMQCWSLPMYMNSYYYQESQVWESGSNFMIVKILNLRCNYR